MTNLPPIHPERLNALRGVECHFQTDRDFMVTYSSSEEASALKSASAECLKFALEVAEASGFGLINELVAHTGRSKFILFSLNPSSVQNPGPRSFGVKINAETNVRDLVTSVNEIVHR